MLRQGQMVIWLLFAGSIAYFLAIYGVLPIVRFKLPITMLYVPVSALGIQRIIGYLSEKKKS
jgi:hypothetical protein